MNRNKARSRRQLKGGRISGLMASRFSDQSLRRLRVYHLNQRKRIDRELEKAIGRSKKVFLPSFIRFPSILAIKSNKSDGEKNEKRSKCWSQFLLRLRLWQLLHFFSE